MATTEREQFLTYRDQVARLAEQTKRKSPAKLKAIAQYLSELEAITQAYGMRGVSRSLVIGLNTALRWLKRSQSGLGLFSDDFEGLAESCSKQLAKISFKQPDGASIRLLKGYIEIVIITVAGLLHLAAKQSPKRKEDEEEIDESVELFRKELIVSLFFHTEYPKEVFYQMAETLEATKTGAKLIAEVLEAIALMTALTTFSSKKAALDENLLKSLIPRLSSCLDKISKDLAEAQRSGEEEGIETAAMRAFLRQIKMAFEQQDIDTILKTFTDIFETYGFLKEHLKADIEAIKTLFDLYEEAFLAKRQQQTMAVDVIG